MSLLEFKIIVAAFVMGGFVIGFAVCNLWPDWIDLKKELKKENEYDNFLNDQP